MSTINGEHGSTSRQRDAKDKGKGIASENATPARATAPEESRPDDVMQQKSHPTRIAESGTSLAKSLLSGHLGVNHLPQYTSSTTSKAGPSQRDNHGGQSLEESSLSSSSRPTVPSASDRTFRSSHVQDHVAQQESAFSNFLDGVDGLDVAPQSVGSSNRNTTQWPISQVHEDGVNQRTLSKEQPSSTTSHQEADIDRQEAQDGAAVVDILSEYHEEPPADDPEPSLSEEEVEKVRKALFGGQHGKESNPRDWDHALNFIPDFVRPDQDRDHSHASSNREKSEETYSTLGLSHSPEASRVWVEQWEDVLSRYTDEVWGDLLPLVGKAKKELQELEKAPVLGDNVSSTKAFDRLRQILSQIRGV